MDEWIYDEDPKVSGEYLVTAICNEGYYEESKVVRVFYYEKEPHWGGNPVWMRRCEDEGGYFTTVDKVIAWRPCPEPAEVK